jgi:acyl-CoA synthetase (AMP-forming)/AMP-acid ligase II
MQATPATWQLLLSSGWQGDKSLKALCGGEALDNRLAETLLGSVGSLWNMYGPTETTIWSAALPIESANLGSIPLGPPIANTTFYVVDTKNEPVPIGVAGELLIGGEGLARGYLNRPDLTAEKFISDPFSPLTGARLYRTGDLVRYKNDGTLQFLGRLDHQVKLRGFRIELGEIESVLRREPGVEDAVVLLKGINDDKQLLAWLKADEQYWQNTSGLREKLRQSLPEYMVPSRVFYLKDFPRTPNGKLDRNMLKIPERQSEDEQPLPTEKLTPLQESIARTFRELLNLEKVSLRENFFDIGAHSLLLVRAHHRLKQEVYSQLTLVNFFQYPTIGSLAEFIRGHKIEKVNSLASLHSEA